MSTAVLEAHIRAFDQFSREMQRYQQELTRIRRQQDDTRDDTERLNRSHASFLQTVGQLATLYAFQRALREVASTGREFELTIKQAQAVTGDFSTKLRDMAMAAEGIHKPTELAQAYRELGAAGADINDILAATPEILDFSTASLLSMDQSATAVLSTAKSFNIALSESGQIVDAYTEAMNLGALAGQDFQWIMSSAGAVAKMAGQDFREILSVGSAMRDSGIQAQDAGTSIKSALMALINPTKEAKELMSELGISVYDASGKMKQWSEITAEFERALAPFNEQSRQLALTTIFGSDGIRAMATSLNKGSGYLSEFTQGLKNADGATHQMASAMADTFDGALKKANANLEKTKILIFEDIVPAMTAVLGGINNLIVGFNSLGQTSRMLIEIFIGAVGLTVALGFLATKGATLLAIISQLTGATFTWASAMAIITGPAGWITAAVVGVTALTAATLHYKGAQEESNRKLKESVKENLSQAQSIEKLLVKYKDLSSQTNLTESEQDQLKKTIKDLTDAVPSAITGFDAMGNAITNVGIASDATRQKITELRQEAVRNAELNANIARAQIPELERKKAEAELERDKLAKSLSIGNTQGAYLSADRLFKGVYQGLALSGLKDDKEIAYEAADLAKKARDNWEAANKELTAAQSAIKIADELKSGKYTETSDGGGKNNSGVTTGTRTLTPSSSSSKSNSSKNEAAETAKSYTEAITEALYPYKAATEAAANAVSLLGAKEQYLSQIMDSGQGTIYQGIELYKVRNEQVTALSEQQEKLHKQADAERLALANVKEQYANAIDPDAIKELRQEMDSLNHSIAQSGQAWWQAEQQKLALTEKVKQEEKKRYDDAYSQSMDLMRHQVNMARMSTEQQIEYLQKLRDAHEWSQQQIREINEDLYRLSKQQLSDYLSSLEDEYKSKLDSIDQRTEDSVNSLQAQIDALDEEGNTSNREDTARKHNEKLAELQEKRQYHELRTGKEHKEAISDIDKEIAEEQLKFQRQQEEWAREDKKDALQQQIEDVQDAGEEERKRLEEHYRKVVDLANEGALDTLAALAATNPKWLEVGKNWIKNLMDGIELMEPEFQAKVQQATSAMGGYKTQLPSVETTPEVHSKYWPYKSAINEIVWLKGQWKEGYESGDQTKMSQSAEAAKGYYNKLPSNIADLLRGMNYDAAYAWYKSQVYHDGGMVTKYGPRRLASDEIPIIAQEGEVVLSTSLVDAIRRMTIPAAVVNQGVGQGGYNVQHIYNAPLYNSERTYINNETNAQVTAREVYGLQKSAARAKGG